MPEPVLHIEYHPSLVEQAVFLAARQNQQTERQLRANLDAVYKIADANARESGFSQVHERWFVRLGLDASVRDLIQQQPLIELRVQRCHVREAPGRRRQNVELFVRKGTNGEPDIQRALFIDICPDFLLDADQLRPWLQRELLKVADMLDEAFEYSPVVPETHRAKQNLIRDRYGLLWDCYVEARLQPASNSADLHPRLRERFERAFSCGGAGASLQCLTVLLGLTATTHSCLLGWALEPDTMPGWRSESKSALQMAGELCPLCRFPTYDWYNLCNDADGRIHAVISSIQPIWRSEQGVCRQCAETCANGAGLRARKETMK
jgi:hypothetical protein